MPDVLLIVAVVLFALYALVGFFGAIEARVANLLLGIGLACFAASFITSLG